MAVRGSLLLALLVVGGCASQRLTQQGFEAIELLRALPADARPRVVVAELRDQTNGASSGEFATALSEAGGSSGDWLAGVRELLQTGLLNTGAFTVLERDDLDALADERLWSAKTGEEALARARLEGADIVVAPALTGFEPSGGGALPLPIPLSDDGDFGILWLRTGSASISLDLRLIDVASGRVLKTTAVRGKARNFRVDFDLFLLFSDGYASLPGILGLYNNTPLHAALLKMVTLAVGEIGDATRPGARKIRDAATAALFSTEPITRTESQAAPDPGGAEGAAPDLP